MKKKPILIGIFLVGALAGVFFLLSLFLASILGLNGKIAKSDKIAIINIESIITQSSNTVRQIKKYADDKSIKAIVLRIDSPGGGVAPSQEIYSEILNVRKNSNKIVVTSMGNLAASGGYYIACASNKIVANPGTLTGSIGVIMTFSNIEELMKKIGLKTEIIKSGEFKDIGSPMREFTEKEKKLLQGVIDDVYDQFVNAVSVGRSIAVQKVKELSDGRIFTGRQAFEIGLVDKLGSLEEAIKLAAELVGIEGKPKIVSEKKESNLLFKLLENKVLSYLPKQLHIIPGLQYLWQY
ncbi:MAG TPA: signal peptide peptidase SppA [Nitrospinota bacterium]|jgi:protease-4|nr:signal peptide peptidase SppA [Nitrospinota bacterium]